MADALVQKERTQREQTIVLKLLEHVEDDAGLSQAEFASRVGIAKGLANAYFNRCLQKGWIKLRQVPKQRFLYYLTPNGFAEKAMLTAQFLADSYQFYRDARADLRHAMQAAEADGHARIAILGDGELAEIAAIVSDEVAVEIVGFVAPGSKRKRIVGRPVFDDCAVIDGADAAVLATVDGAGAIHADFTAAHGEVPVYVPSQLTALVWDASP